MSYGIAVSWLLISAVSGLRWIGPQETISATATADWTPAPTNDPNDVSHELLKKDLYPESLCGWQGPGHEGAYCGSSSYCAWVTDIGVVGCCSNGGSCDAVFTTCIDQRNDPPQGPSVAGIMTCSEFCYRNTFPDGYYQYGCGSTSIGQNVVTSWAGANPTFSLAIVSTGGVLKELTDSTLVVQAARTSTIVVGVIVTTSAKPITITATQSEKPPEDLATATVKSPTKIPGEGSTTSSTDTAATSSSTSKISDSAGPQSATQNGLSTRAMIGIGVAAGSIAIAGLALLAFCCIRRRKQRKDSQNFLSAATDGSIQVAQYDQPVMGTRTNPSELYQTLPVPVQSKEAQYHLVTTRESPQYVRESGRTNSIAPSYELNPSYVPVRQASPQSPVSSAFSRSGSPHPSSIAPTPTMYQNPHMYELPTNRASGIPELDSSEARGLGKNTSYGGI